jgi:hypothetical protein
MKIPGWNGIYATYSGERKWRPYVYQGGLRFKIKRMCNIIRAKFGYNPFRGE